MFMVETCLKSMDTSATASYAEEGSFMTTSAMDAVLGVANMKSILGGGPIGSG